MDDLILTTPPWVSCQDKTWADVRSRVVAEYEGDNLPGSYRRLSLMLSEAWDMYCQDKEGRNDG